MGIWLSSARECDISDNLRVESGKYLDWKKWRDKEEIRRREEWKRWLEGEEKSVREIWSKILDEEGDKRRDDSKRIMEVEKVVNEEEFNIKKLDEVELSREQDGEHEEVESEKRTEFDVKEVIQDEYQKWKEDWSTRIRDILMEISNETREKLSDELRKERESMMKEFMGETLKSVNDSLMSHSDRRGKEYEMKYRKDIMTILQNTGEKVGIDVMERRGQLSGQDELMTAVCNMCDKVEKLNLLCGSLQRELQMTRKALKDRIG